MLLLNSDASLTPDAVRQMAASMPGILDARDARLETKIIEGIRRRRYDLG